MSQSSQRIFRIFVYCVVRFPFCSNFKIKRFALFSLPPTARRQFFINPVRISRHCSGHNSGGNTVLPPAPPDRMGTFLPFLPFPKAPDCLPDSSRKNPCKQVARPIAHQRFAAWRSGGFRSTKLSATTELDTKHKASFNH